LDDACWLGFIRFQAFAFLLFLNVLRKTEHLKYYLAHLYVFLFFEYQIEDNKVFKSHNFLILFSLAELGLLEFVSDRLG
jgi:hypothetical protein